MATDRMDVLELLRKATSDGDVDLLREGMRVLSQALMEAEVAAERQHPAGGRPFKSSAPITVTSAVSGVRSARIGNADGDQDERPPAAPLR